jgi:hypothetical protein
MDFSLSINDISKLLDGKVNMITYKEVSGYKTLDDLLGKYKRCVILYLTSKNYGHFTCIFEHKGKISFFDSYGFIPDDELKFIPNDLKKELRSNHRYLTELLYKSDKPVDYSQYQLQSKSPKITTCGRHVVSRLRHMDVNTDDYANIFLKAKKYMPIDELIVKLVPLNKK